MIQLNVVNECSQLKTVVLGTAKSNGPTPEAKDCYDPSSLNHVKARTYPIESQMVQEITALEAVFKAHDVAVFRPQIIPQCNQIFARDVAFVVEDKLIKSNILPDREDEFSAISNILNQIESEKIIELPETCHVEGGDVILYNDYIFIGFYNVLLNGNSKARFPRKIIDVYKSRSRTIFKDIWFFFIG